MIQNPLIQIQMKAVMERGNFSVFMTIAHVESLDDLGALVEEIGEHTE